MRKLAILAAVPCALAISSCTSMDEFARKISGNTEQEPPRQQSQAPATELSDEDKLRFAEESVDLLVEAVRKDDYAAYFKNFAKDHKDLIKEADFKTRNEKFREQCGEYQSREFIGVLKKQLFDVYLWKAKYGKLPKDDILLRLFVVEEDGKPGIYAFNVQPF